MKAYKLLTCLFTLLLATAQATYQHSNNDNNNEPENEYKEFEEGMAKKLPKFLHHKDRELKKLQEGKREAVLVIGQTGAGKSTLIGGLLRHKFAFEQAPDECSDDDEFSDDDEEVLVNKSPNAPKISYNTAASETSFPEAFLDPKTNLAFIDTAGLEDTRKYGDAINLCNAMVLSKIIENIGSLKCIIGVISYNNFIEGKGSKAFLHLSTVLHNLLKNKSLYAKCTSSIVLAFTKVPEHINKEKITKKLKKRCKDLNKMRKNNEMTEEDKQAEVILKVLFPSFYGVNLLGMNVGINKKNVPFFLIKQSSLLKQGLVRNNMLPTLQKAQKINKKDIGRFLAASLLQKIQRWLRTRAESVAKDIIDKKNVANDIAYMQSYLAFKKEELSDEKKFLQQLADPNNKKRQSELIQERLETISQKNNQRIKQLNKKVRDNKKERGNNYDEINKLNTNTIIWYKNVSYIQNGLFNFNYTYDDVPIDHIIYSGDNAKNPKLNQHLQGKFKVTSITKNYQQGKLKITIKHDSWCGSPDDFEIYAKKKDVYHNKITTLKENIDKLKKSYDILKEDKEQLEKEALVDQIQNSIKIKNKEIQKIKRDVKNLKHNLKSLNDRVKQNNIPCIITQVAPFIGVHNNQKHNIDACKQYVNSMQQHNQNNNNHNDNNHNNNNNINSKHSDNQPGLLLGNNNNIEDEEEIKEDDSYKENISSSSNRKFSVFSAVTLGTVGLISRLKKKN